MAWLLPEEVKRKMAAASYAPPESYPKLHREDELSFLYNGWLSPEGDLYRCHFSLHLELAFELGFESYAAIEAAGYVKFKRAEFYADYHPLFGQVTQAQFDRMFDYLILHDKYLPESLAKFRVSEEREESSV